MSTLLAEKLAGLAPGVADESILGKVSPPPGVSIYNRLAGGGVAGPCDIGLILFASNLIKIATIVAGLFVLFNFITAGYDYITQGDTKTNQAVKEKLTNSFLGMILLIGSYVIIGILGLILFGDATYFLNPQITGPGGVC